MLLLPFEAKAKLLENGKPENRDKDHPPAVYISVLGTNCQWLLSELNPEEENIAFGLCDLGMGFPEMGYVDLNEIANLPQAIMLYVRAIETKYSLTTYWKASKVKSQITMDEKLLMQASHGKKSGPSF